MTVYLSKPIADRIKADAIAEHRSAAAQVAVIVEAALASDQKRKKAE